MAPMHTNDTGRFAPTTSGRAHPGTLVAAMLSWCDARSRGARYILRMEDIDPSSVQDHWRRDLLADLVWFGLDWDELVWQSACRPTHEALMDLLADTGRLYECGCSRSDIQKAGLVSASGGWVYPGTCRHKTIRHWRDSRENIRVNLGGMEIVLQDESGLDLGQMLDTAMGDPLLRRKDGSMTYQLAVVADDHASAVGRVVRGRDIASSTATQVALHRLVGWDQPCYRHHVLLLEPRGEKLAKFHGSVSVEKLALHYTPGELRACLGAVIGLVPWEAHAGSPKTPSISPGELLACFDWAKVVNEDRVLGFDGNRLIF